MKSLNYRFPHSRQDSGQMNLTRSQLGQAQQVTNVLNNRQNEQNVDRSPAPMVHGLHKLAVPSSQQSSANHSKKSSISKQQQPKQISFLNYLILKDKSQIVQDEEKENITEPVVQKNMFNFQFVIGIGGFGKVWKVEYKKNGQIYAMKEMSKALIIAKKSVNSVMNERNILSNLKHPEYLLRILRPREPIPSAGLHVRRRLEIHLRYLQIELIFKYELNKGFFMACIFLGLEYMHSKNSLHRDIKPENLVLDKHGYVRITDLGIARNLRPDNSQDTSGTPGYMGIFIILNSQLQKLCVDKIILSRLIISLWESLDTSLCWGSDHTLGDQERKLEIRFWLSKFKLKDRKFQIQSLNSHLFYNWSLESADFINRLIQRKPANRLGFNGPHELRQHSWFKNFPWSKLMNKELKSPYIPNQNEDNFDARQISMEDDENNELIQQHSIMLRRNSIQSQFSGYEMDNFSEKQITQFNNF